LLVIGAPLPAVPPAPGVPGVNLWTTGIVAGVIA
jgi:hypothetical protein